MLKKRNKILLYVIIIFIILISFCSWHVIKWKIFQKQLKGKIVSGTMIWDPKHSTSGFLSRIPLPQRATGIEISLDRGMSIAYSSWSPDAQKIVFVNYEGGSTSSKGLLIVDVSKYNIPSKKLITVDIDEEKLQRFLSMENVSYPSWSPDGTKIAFCVEPKVIHDAEKLPYYGLRYLYVASVDNPVPMLVTNEGCSAGVPSWSPDSKRILFASGLDPGRIYTINLVGTDLTMIGNGLIPSWSPDGTKIAFLYKGNIYIMGPDGKNIRLLVRNCSLDYRFPSQIVWSPDGKFIIYCVPAMSIVPSLVYKTVVVSARYCWWKTWIKYESYYNSSISWTK